MEHGLPIQCLGSRYFNSYEVEGGHERGCTPLLPRYYTPELVVLYILRYSYFRCTIGIVKAINCARVNIAFS